MPRRKQRMTGIERLIVAAIIGLLFSIILPNLQRAQKRSRVIRPRDSTPIVGRQRAEPSGQLNTIEVTETSGGGARTSPAGLGRFIGALLRLIIVAAVVGIIVAVLRQKLKSAQQ